MTILTRKDNPDYEGELWVYEITPDSITITDWPFGDCDGTGDGNCLLTTFPREKIAEVIKNLQAGNWGRYGNLSPKQAYKLARALHDLC